MNTYQVHTYVYIPNSIMNKHELGGNLFIVSSIWIHLLLLADLSHAPWEVYEIDSAVLDSFLFYLFSRSQLNCTPPEHHHHHHHHLTLNFLPIKYKWPPNHWFPIKYWYRAKGVYHIDGRVYMDKREFILMKVICIISCHEIDIPARFAIRCFFVAPPTMIVLITTSPRVPDHAD